MQREDVQVCSAKRNVFLGLVRSSVSSILVARGALRAGEADRVPKSWDNLVVVYFLRGAGSVRLSGRGPQSILILWMSILVVR